MIQTAIRRLDAATGPVIGTLARLTFAATLAGYYWASALTKIDGGSISINGYAQIFPKAMEAVNYDASQLSAFHTLVVAAGTAAEFVLPALLIVGLLTRLAALGMIGFVAVQTLTDLFGHGDGTGDIFDAPVRAGHDRNTGGLGSLAGGNLVAHPFNRIGRGADEDQTGRFDGAGKGGAFRQEAIARVDCIGTGVLGGLQDRIDLQIAVFRRGRPDADGFVRQLDRQHIGIGLGMGLDRMDAKRLCRPNDPNGDFAPVRNE